MIDSTERLSVSDQLDIAGDYLIERGITLVVDERRWLSAGEMWCEAAEESGRRIALICTYGQRIESLTDVKVSYDYAQTDVAQAIVEVFGAIDGCTASWTGSPTNAVQVKLG
jgi:hypothetical protein